MSEEFSSRGLLAYLREAAVTGRLRPATARSRRKAAEALLPFLDAGEAADLRALDIGVLRRRIVDSPRADLRAEVALVYAERLAEALDDYLGDYLGDPSPADRGARGSTPPSAGPSTRSGDSAVTKAAYAVDESRLKAESPERMQEIEARALEAVQLRSDGYRPDVFPIPLGPNRIVYLHGLPQDLTPAEARRIARILEALASTDA
ncbi:MAG: hypothetical protein V2I82_07715 [Halieaceae bacterium]|jgi:hypothetical protein|nr:hypothetical protein [Halieaceae bacterium]